MLRRVKCFQHFLSDDFAGRSTAAKFSKVCAFRLQNKARVYIILALFSDLANCTNIH